jgi:hypothetical protein
LPLPAKRAEDLIPKAGRHPKIGGSVKMVMQRMAPLQAINVTRMRRVPMMQDVMNADVPEIAEH